MSVDLPHSHVVEAEGRTLRVGQLRALMERLPDESMILVDGNRCPKWERPSVAIVSGDAKCRSIAAASIVAKVTRDRIMADYAREHPGYGWERNKGYGTPEHQEALGRLGPTPLHRRSFAPVRQYMMDL